MSKILNFMYISWQFLKSTEECRITWKNVTKYYSMEKQFAKEYSVYTIFTQKIHTDMHTQSTEKVSGKKMPQCPQLWIVGTKVTMIYSSLSFTFSEAEP